MAAHFLDIGGIVYHHCLNFLFIKSYLVVSKRRVWWFNF